jgi:hypothetical protein
MRLWGVILWKIQMKRFEGYHPTWIEGHRDIGGGSQI